MAVKRVYVKFASNKIDVRDHIVALNNAVEHANVNLEKRHKIYIELEVLGDQVFIWVVSKNKEPINYGNHLRGVSNYLIKHGGYKDNSYVDFSKYRVGNRLLVYTPATV